MYNSSCDDKLRRNWFSCNEQRFSVPLKFPRQRVSSLQMVDCPVSDRTGSSATSVRSV